MPIPATTPIVVLTGAGISAESGLPTFRAGDGLWEDHRVEDVASPGGWIRDRALVQRFYNERRRKLREVVPNAAHRALVRLEQAWPGGVLVVTQNVDDLHDRAGSRALVHMHGELRKARCLVCGAVSSWDGDLGPESVCPSCAKPGNLRPHIVWFGEMPLEMDRILRALGSCGLFAAIGTSGNVYPAAGFVEALAPGTPAVELNLEPSLRSHAFQTRLLGPATQVVPAWVDDLLDALPSRR